MSFCISITTYFHDLPQVCLWAWLVCLCVVEKVLTKYVYYLTVYNVIAKITDFHFLYFVLNALQISLYPTQSCEVCLLQPCFRRIMMTSSNGNIFRVTGYLCGEYPKQKPVTRSFDVFFDLRPNKRLSKQWWGWWFETPSCPLWCHCNVMKYIPTYHYQFSLRVASHYRTPQLRNLTSPIIRDVPWLDYSKLEMFRRHTITDDSLKVYDWLQPLQYEVIWFEPDRMHKNEPAVVFAKSNLCLV